MSKHHLCNDCRFHVATCGAKELKFGNGKGNDNVIACDSFVFNPDIVGWICEGELTESVGLVLNWLYHDHIVINLNEYQLREIKSKVEEVISEFAFK